MKEEIIAKIIEMVKPTSCKECDFKKISSSFLATITKIECKLTKEQFDMGFYDHCSNRHKSCPFGITNKKIYGNHY